MKILDKTGTMPLHDRIIAVCWLTFLVAGVATGILFSLIDPLEIQLCLDVPEFSRTTAYSTGFFCFWFLSAFSGLICVMFTYPELNGQS